MSLRFNKKAKNPITLKNTTVNGNRPGQDCCSFFPSLNEEEFNVLSYFTFKSSSEIVSGESTICDQDEKVRY
jgi:hypothetical protein